MEEINNLEDFIKEYGHPKVDFEMQDPKFEGCDAIPFNVYNRLVKIYYSSEN